MTSGADLEGAGVGTGAGVATGARVFPGASGAGVGAVLGAGVGPGASDGFAASSVGGAGVRGAVGCNDAMDEAEGGIDMPVGIGAGDGGKIPAGGKLVGVTGPKVELGVMAATGAGVVDAATSGPAVVAGMGAAVGCPSSTGVGDGEAPPGAAEISKVGEDAGAGGGEGIIGGGDGSTTSGCCVAAEAGPGEDTGGCGDGILISLVGAVVAGDPDPAGEAVV